MFSITQVQDRLNDCAGQLAVLDLALSSHRVSDCLEEDVINGFAALLYDVSDTLETVVSELDAFKQTYTPEEKEKFMKAANTIRQIHAAIDPKVAVN